MTNEIIKNAIKNIRGWNERERELMGVMTLAGIREYVRNEIEENREEAPVEFVMPSEEDHRCALVGASMAVSFDMRPSDKQINYLAALMFKNGEAVRYSGVLTKKMASNLIGSF